MRAFCAAALACGLAGDARAQYSEITSLGVNVVEQATSMPGMTTYRLSVTLGAEQTNVYALFGEASPPAPLEMPAAYQCATPFGASIGGANPAFFAIANNAAVGFAEFDSWLTIGVSDGSAPGAISASPGFDLNSWSATAPLSTSDGAIFWMDPHAAPVEDDVVLAQLTMATGTIWTARCNVQGHSTLRDDFQQLNIVFTNGAAAPPPPAPAPPPRVVPGCTTRTATNYDPAATSDDGSCTFAVPGCMAALATNYNPAATSDDGSCAFVVPGCMSAAATNYNPAATSDNGSCVCPLGYIGANCGQNIDECAAMPCQNGGRCQDGVNAYTCACVGGYTGLTCATAPARPTTPPPPAPPVLPPPTPPPAPPAGAGGCVDDPACATPSYTQMLALAAGNNMLVCADWAPAIQQVVEPQLQPPLPAGMHMEDLCPVVCLAPACSGAAPPPPPAGGGCVDDPVCASYTTVLSQAAAIGQTVCETWAAETKNAVEGQLQPRLPVGMHMEDLCPMACFSTGCGGAVPAGPPPPPVVVTPPPPPPPSRDVPGCMVAVATNFNPVATSDDGSCVCPAGLSGPSCRTSTPVVPSPPSPPVSPPPPASLSGGCASAPCQNGGVCGVQGAEYTCRCTNGFGGDDCEDNSNSATDDQVSHDTADDIWCDFTTK